MSKILLIEDDTDLCFTISTWFSAQAHTVEVVTDGQDGLDRLLGGHYDVVVLDIGLPRVCGIDICKQYRQRGGKTPLLLLTGRNTTDSKIEGLDSGADDYLTKPFVMRELGARVRALLRRPPGLQGEVLECGEIQMDIAGRAVTKRGMPVQLIPTDFALLEFLMRHPGQVFSQDALLDRVWHTDKDATSDSLRSAIKRLRRALDDDNAESFIETVHRAGYRLRVQ